MGEEGGRRKVGEEGREQGNSEKQLDSLNDPGMENLSDSS